MNDPASVIAKFSFLASKLQDQIDDLEKLIKPCCCDEHVGMCVPCAMRDRVAGGDSISEVVKDYE